MSIDRNSAVVPVRHDAAVPRATGKDRRQAGAPSFELPVPKEPDAAKPDTRRQQESRDTANTRASQMDVSGERNPRSETESRERTSACDANARSDTSFESDGEASDRQHSAASHSTPGGERASAKPGRGDVNRRNTGHAGMHSAAEASEDSPAGTAPYKAAPRAKSDPAASEPRDATPSLAERMLALLSGTLGVATASAPARASPPFPSQLGGDPGAAPMTGLPGSIVAGNAPGLAPSVAGDATLPAGSLIASVNADNASLQAAAVLPGAAQVSASATLSAATAATPAGIAPAAPTLASSSDAAINTLAAAVHGFSTSLARAGASSNDTDIAPDSATAPGNVDASALLAHAVTDLPATSTVQAAPVAMPTDPDAGFGDELCSRVVWMAEQKLGHAEIRVNPENLGPIDIRLQMDGHRISAQFHAANPDVRHALEAGMGRLRDLLGRHGMELSDSQVGSQHRQRSDDRAGASGGGPFASGTESTNPAPPTTTLRALRARGLIDEYV